MFFSGNVAVTRGVLNTKVGEKNMHIEIGQIAIISIISHIIFIYLTWKVIVTINFEPLIRKGRVTEARILILFITIVIGSGVSRFFLEIFQWSRDLLYFF